MQQTNRKSTLNPNVMRIIPIIILALASIPVSWQKTAWWTTFLLVWRMLLIFRQHQWVLSVWGEQNSFFPSYVLIGMLLKDMVESSLLSKYELLTADIDGVMGLWFFRKRAQNTKIDKNWSKDFDSAPRAHYLTTMILWNGLNHSFFTQDGNIDLSPAIKIMHAN